MLFLGPTSLCGLDWGHGPQGTSRTAYSRAEWRKIVDCAVNTRINEDRRQDRTNTSAECRISKTVSCAFDVRTYTCQKTCERLQRLHTTELNLSAVLMRSASWSMNCDVVRAFVSVQLMCPRSTTEDRVTVSVLR